MKLSIFNANFVINGKIWVNMSLLDNIKLNEKFWEKYLESYDVLNSVLSFIM